MLSDLAQMRSFLQFPVDLHHIQAVEERQLDLHRFDEMLQKKTLILHSVLPVCMRIIT